MKYYVQQNPEAKHGYELVEVAENGQETIIALDRKTPDHYLYLPEACKTATNRTFIGINCLNKANQPRYELTPKEYKAPRVLGSYSQSKKPLEDYLEPEEKALYLELMEKAKKRREEANRPLTALEKAMKERDKWLARIAELKAMEEAK